MHPQREVIKFRKGRFYKNPTISSFKRIVPSNRPVAVDVNGFPQRHRRHYVQAGMFANAKSSLPSSANVSFQNSDDNLSTSRGRSASPTPIRKFSNFPRSNISKTWDFSDIGVKKDQQTRNQLPPMKRLNSEEEEEQQGKTKTTKKETIGASTVGRSVKHVLPWLKKWGSQDAESNMKPMRIERLKVSPTLDQSINRFSSRLRRIDSIRPIPLQNHTGTTIGTVEKALVAVALAKTKSEEYQKNPVFDYLIERSDWLLYREEFNDKIDYLPQDPFYSHDIVSSDFEEYEQEIEEARDPYYLEIGSEEKQAPIKASASKPRFDEANFHNEDPLNLDSQEDFFETSYLPKNADESKKHQKSMLPSFGDYTTKSDDERQKNRLVSFDTDSSVPRTSRKRNHQEALSPSKSNPDYSPFNYDAWRQAW